MHIIAISQSVPRTPKAAGAGNGQCASSPCVKCHAARRVSIRGHSRQRSFGSCWLQLITAEERRADAGAQGQGGEAGPDADGQAESQGQEIYSRSDNKSSHCLRLLTMSKPRVLAVQNYFFQRISLGKLTTLDVYKMSGQSRNFFDETSVMWVEHSLANIIGPDRQTTVESTI